MVTQLRSPLNDIKDVVQFKTLFNLQQAYIKRTKTPFTLVFINFHSENELDEKAASLHYEMLSKFLLSQVRSSDFIFESKSQQYTIALLSFSDEFEASFFVKRIKNNVNDYFKKFSMQNEISLRTVTVEITNSLSTIDTILQAGVETLIALPTNKSEITMHNFSEREVEKIKVSIIENDPIVLAILKNLMERTTVKYFDFEIQTFSDGLTFLQSNWYQSDHTHIVLLNDILPRVNGIEVLKTLRGLPNTQKYIIFMMSKRQGDEATSYAFENGVDAYFTRPFNLRLISAQIKSILKRLRL